MFNANRPTIRAAAGRLLSALLLGAAGAVAAGCDGKPGADDGEVINVIVLPSDTLLNLACEDVGIFTEVAPGRVASRVMIGSSRRAPESRR